MSSPLNLASLYLLITLLPGRGGSMGETRGVLIQYITNHHCDWSTQTDQNSSLFLTRYVQFKTIILIALSNINLGQLQRLIINHLLVNVSLVLQFVPNHYLISPTLTFYSIDNNCNYLEHIDQSCIKITTLLGKIVSTNCNKTYYN